MKVRSPITVFWNGAYHPPGTVIDLEEDEARRFIERFGHANDTEIVNTLEDLASVEALNKHAAINGGTGND
jgi:hypothetical protein